MNRLRYSRYSHAHRHGDSVIRRGVNRHSEILRLLHSVLLDVVSLLRLSEARWPIDGATEACSDRAAICRVTRRHVLALIIVGKSGGRVGQELRPRFGHLLKLLLVLVQCHRVPQHDPLFTAADGGRWDAARQQHAILRLSRHALVQINALLLHQKYLRILIRGEG